MWDHDFRDSYILIETTDFCNLNCIMCSHENIPGPHSRPKGFMNFETFRKITDDIPGKTVPAGYKLFWLGEPLLNPDFSSMLSHLYNIISSRQEYIDLHTNAHFLTPEVRKLLFSCGSKIPRLTISMDAVTQDTYSRIRRGGDLKKVHDNLTAFLEERSELGLTQPTLIFQFIIMEENSHEALDFLKFWTEKVQNSRKRSLLQKFTHNLFSDSLTDVVWFKRLDVPPEKRAQAEKIYLDTVKKFNLRKMRTPDLEVIVSCDNLWDSDPAESLKEVKTVSDQPEQVIRPSSDDSVPALTENRRPVCSALFKSPCIMWDGTLTVCCFDPAMQFALGNLNKSSFRELWYGEKMESYRLAHIRGEFSSMLTSDGFPKCLHCSGYDTPRITDDEIRTYLERTGRESEWTLYHKRRYG